MAVRIRLIRSLDVRAHASVTLAAGVWMSDIQVVESDSALTVRFPDCLEFERPETRAKWEARILEAYRAEAKVRSPPAPLQHLAVEPGPTTLIYTAGAARGNPGPGAAAAVIAVPGRPPIELAQSLESASPSGAVHAAIVLALREVARLRASGVEVKVVVVRGDHALTLKHMQGVWGVDDPELQALAASCREIADGALLQVKYEHVGAVENRAAIALVERCLEAG